MAKDSSFHDYVMNELFSTFDDIHSRSMFGGWGIYKQSLRPLGLKNDIFFALISSGQLFFKVADKNKVAFQKYGSKPFVYIGSKGKRVTLSYWELPAEIVENTEELPEWVDRAIEAAKK